MVTMAPINIALNLLYIEPSHLTGPGYYAAQLLEHMVDLLPPSGPKSLSAYIRPAARHHFSDKVQPYLRVVDFKGGRIKRVLVEQIILPIRTRRDGVTLLFSPTFVSPMWGARYMAVTIHDMYYRVCPDLVENYQLKYWKYMIPASAMACDLIVAVSENTAIDVRKYIPAAQHKTVAIPSASRLSPPLSNDPTPVRPAKVGNAPFLLMIANMTPNKNPQVVVKAIADLREQGRSIRLVHAGKDHLGLLAQAVADHNAGDLVVSLGKVSDTDLVALYRTCLAAVVSSFYEGFGMPAVEAQSQGAPLLSSNRGSLPEAGGDAALYFDPDDHNALKRHIELLLDNPGERDAIIARGRISAERFSWAKTAQKTLAALEAILEPQS